MYIYHLIKHHKDLNDYSQMTYKYHKKKDYLYYNQLYQNHIFLKYLLLKKNHYYEEEIYLLLSPYQYNDHCLILNLNDYE